MRRNRGAALANPDLYRLRRKAPWNFLRNCHPEDGTAPVFAQKCSQEIRRKGEIESPVREEMVPVKRANPRPAAQTRLAQVQFLHEIRLDSPDRHNPSIGREVIEDQLSTSIAVSFSSRKDLLFAPIGIRCTTEKDIFHVRETKILFPLTQRHYPEERRKSA
jgi:hypothetical protein